MQVIAWILAVAAASPSAQQLDIPQAYRGTWALSPATCQNATSADKVTIEPRRISFYESDAFLRLAQLNEISEPPHFYGLFESAGELSFWEQTIRLEMDRGALHITSIKDKTDGASPERWVRCSG